MSFCMAVFQVEDVNKMFDNLEEMRNNNWKDSISEGNDTNVCQLQPYFPCVFLVAHDCNALSLMKYHRKLARAKSQGKQNLRYAYYLEICFDLAHCIVDYSLLIKKIVSFVLRRFGKYLSVMIVMVWTPTLVYPLFTYFSSNVKYSV